MSDENEAAGNDPAAEPVEEELLDAGIIDETEFIDLEAQFAGNDPAALVAERDEYRDTMLRVKAEFDNYKKRAARDEITLRERANENLVEKMLVIFDACEAAIGHGATDVEPIAKMLLDMLEREGLVRLTPSGEPFDPNQHDAVMHEEGDGGDAIVVETLRTGYQWKSRVLRPAMVKVRG
jgi:molecular chaperone GrpE